MEELALPEDAAVIVEDVPAELSARDKLITLAQMAGDISHMLSDSDLTDIGRKVVDGYNQDKTDRSEWEETVKEALKAASQEAKGETKTYPWPNAADIKYPLLTVGALQFNARAYPAVVKGDEAVSVKVIGKDSGQQQQQQPAMPGMPPAPQEGPQQGAKSKRAARVRDYMNTTVFYRMDDWEEDTDALLLQLPIVGCVFRKVFYDSRADMQRSAMVPALRLLAPKGAKSCKTAPRLTEEIPDVFPIDIIERIRDGFYRDVDLYAGEEGIDATHDENPRMLLEQHRLLDMDDDGLPEPYIVTVDFNTAQVLRIEPNFSVDAVKFDGERALRIEPNQFYVKYDFFPHPEGKFYGIGLGHLLKQIGGVINTAINQMIDAGTAAVAGGGFVASGVRLTGSRRSGNLRFLPGEYKTVDATGDQLRNGIVERTFPQASPIMFQVLEMMLGAAKDISSVKDVITGDASNNGQVGTTLALIEQGLQVFTAIYKRTYRALKAEFTLLYTNMGRYATDAVKEDYRNVLDDPEADFDADFRASDMDIRPVSDPSSVTRMQALARAQFLMQFVAAPGVNPQAIIRRVWEAADVEDIDELLMPPAPEQPNPKDVADAHKAEAGAALDMERAATEKAKREQMQLQTLAEAFQGGHKVGQMAA